MRPKTFAQWLENHVDKNTPVGEMAREWLRIQGDPLFDDCKPHPADEFLNSDYYAPDRVATLGQALASYSAYVKRWAVRHGV